MGRKSIHREALLHGALACLSEQGYARTTARDVVARSGANLASISYHYGSLEQLLNEALLLGFERLTDELEGSLAGIGDHVDKVAVIVREVPAWFARNRPLVRALFEACAQAEGSPAVREGLVRDYERGRQLVIGLLTDLPSDDPDARLLASLVLALFDGLLMQWLIDPEHAPTVEDLERAVAMVSGLLGAAR